MPKPAFSAVRKEALSESVYRQLADKILRGELPPGDTLPAERELSEVLGVNRGAVREAIKRLQQAGLVAVRQGGNSVVLDYLSEGGMELLPSLLVHKDGRLNGTVVRSIMAMRSSLAPDIAAAAARKGGERLADDLDARLTRMRADIDDLRALQQHALEYWKHLVERGGNIAFRLAFNSMTKTYTQVWDVLAAVLEAEFRDFDNLGAIALAVRAQDAEAARAAGRRHVEIGRQSLERALDAVEKQGGRL
ncbi:MAG: GntR family transcriptional regulator [Sinimarinibacterium sp.]|jgi:DNA-binding FadR family transcriptional regulator